MFATRVALSSPSRHCVVIGGGIAGLCSALHLAKLNFSVDLVERDQIASGTTWHAAGLLGRISGMSDVVEMRRYGSEFYQKLADEFKTEHGYVQNGGLAIATNADRWAALQRTYATMVNAGAVARLLTDKDEILKRYPLLNCDDVYGAVFSPLDGQINPVDVCNSTLLAAIKATNRIKLRLKTAVSRIIVKDGAVTGVELSNGNKIHADYVLLCGGMWSRQLAHTCRASAPLWPCEHHYVLTEPLPPEAGVAKLPVLRSYEELTYFKSDAGKLLIGFFEQHALPAFADREDVPNDFSFGTFDTKLSHLEPLLEAAFKRLPILASLGLQTTFTGPESFTPDGWPLLGESAEVQRLYLCTGFNSHGITFGPAASRMVAQLMDSDGQSIATIPWRMSAQRFDFSTSSNTHFLKAVAAFTLGEQYGAPQSSAGLAKEFGQALAIPPDMYYAETELQHGFAVPVRIHRPASEGAALDEDAVLRQGVCLADLSDTAAVVIQAHGDHGGEAVLSFLQGFVEEEIMGTPTMSIVRATLRTRRQGAPVVACNIIRASKAHFLLQGPPGTHIMLKTFLQRAAKRGGLGSALLIHEMTCANALLAIAGERMLEVVAMAADTKLEELQGKLGDTAHANNVVAVAFDEHQGLLFRAEQPDSTLRLILQRSSAVRVAEVVSAAAARLGLPTALVGRRALLAYERRRLDPSDPHCAGHALAMLES